MPRLAGGPRGPLAFSSAFFFDIAPLVDQLPLSISEWHFLESAANSVS